MNCNSRYLVKKNLLFRIIINNNFILNVLLLKVLTLNVLHPLGNRGLKNQKIRSLVGLICKNPILDLWSHN